MGVFEQFPYSNYHDLNLDWILSEIKRLSETVGTYDEHLAHLDSEIVRVEGKIPDVVQGPGYRTDAVMSQKAVTDAIAAFSGVRSIENYHQELGRLTPVRYFADRVYRFDDDHVGDFDTQEGGSCARYHIDDAEAPHIIMTSGLYDSSDTRQLAAAAAFDVEIPTSTDIPLEIWTVPASESDYEISVDLPGGTVTVLVNSFINSDPGMAKVLSGVWEWDGQPDNSVGSEALMIGAVTALKIGDGAVITSKLALNAVGESAIQDGAVTTGKIADNAVTVNKIANGAVIAPKIGYNAVTTEKIADNAVTAGKIESSAITSAKLASDSVTAPKLADGAVRTAAFSAAARAPGVQIQTSTPVESLGDNGYKIALLDSEPSTKYPGWVYLIKGTPAQGLPAVTASDNGKTLKVDNGGWDVKEPADRYVLNATEESDLSNLLQTFLGSLIQNGGAITVYESTSITFPNVAARAAVAFNTGNVFQATVNVLGSTYTMTAQAIAANGTVALNTIIFTSIGTTRIVANINIGIQNSRTVAIGYGVIS